MPIALDWEFNFGKHQGKTLRWVSNNDTGYMLWCFSKIRWFQKAIKESPDIQKYLKERADDYIQEELEEHGKHEMYIDTFWNCQ